VKQFIASLIAVVSVTVGLVVAQGAEQSVSAGRGDHHWCC